jgi:hypothetical protein
MTLGMDIDAQLSQYFAGIWPHLDEHARRLVAANKAVELGYGGISRVSRVCSLSRVTLTKGVEELQAAPLPPGRIRHEGGGRHALTSNDPGLAPAVRAVVFIEDRLPNLQPLEFEQVRRTSKEPLFNSLMEEYHYLGYEQPVGEHLKYL